jgi:uridylate kinase
MTLEAQGEKKRTIISLGGSILIPDDIDTDFLRAFRDAITARVAHGDTFLMIIGGGRTSHDYQMALRKLGVSSDELVDWMGIYATQFNAELVRIVFGDLAFGKLVNDPTDYEPTSFPIIVGGGNLPGCSSDMGAVRFARATGARRVINLSNVRVVYDSDPNTHPGAQPLHEITWAHYRSIIPSEWTPGLNTPFDPAASKEAEQDGIEVIVAHGGDLENLKKVLDGGDFLGTIIK